MAKYNNDGALKQAAADASSAASAAADSASASAAAGAAAAGATAAAAKAASDAAAAAAAANPGDAGAAAAAAAAKAASDAAQAAKTAADNAAAKAAADAAKTAADAAQKAADDTSVYSPGINSGDYGGTAPGDISGRFHQFLTDMKATSLFSLPSQMIGTIPGGGTSIVTFSGGRFGNHTYDFSTWGSILTTLKALVMVICGISAVKIVTLKGGGG